MRTRRLPTVLVLALIASSSFIPLSQAASSSSDAGQASSLGLMANFEEWLLSTVQQVQEMLGFESPQASPGSYPPSIQSDCRSGIDPNGGGCTS